MVTQQSLSEITTYKNQNLLELSKQGPVLLVFLRYFGCIFCKESIFDIAKKRETFENQHIKIVFVHMAEYEVANNFFKGYGLEDVDHISDIECKHYVTFGLLKGSFSQLFGLKAFIRGFEIMATKKLVPDIVGRIGDGFQMPGIFLIRDAVILQSFIHKSAGDKPNYEDFIAKCNL